MIARAWRRFAEARAARHTDPISPEEREHLRGANVEAKALRQPRGRRRRELVRQVIANARRGAS